MTVAQSTNEVFLKGKKGVGWRISLRRKRDVGGEEEE